MKTRLIIIVIFLIGCFSGCGISQKEMDKTSLRLVSLAPNTTEILFALGLDKEIVGVDTYSNYPAEAQDKPKVGSFSQPDIEKILSLRPDYIFMTALEQQEAIEKLRRLKFNVVITHPQNFKELFKNIEEIGALTGKKEEARKIIEEMKNEINIVKNNIKPKRPRVYFEIWHDPVLTVGPGSFVDEMITLAGGRNIAYDAPRAYSRFSPELIVERDPEIIILGYMSRSGEAREALKKRVGWENISAVKRGAIFDDINPDLILRPGPRAVIGLKEIQKRLYSSSETSKIEARVLQ